MSPESLQELVGLALACGASDVGGPLTKSEVALASCAATVTKTAARRVRAAVRDGGDPLGDGFCALQPPRRRRPMGAFYTGAGILQPMMEWALEQRPDRFIDPGCGSGRFAVAAATRSRRLDVIAIDIDPLATLLARAALASIGAIRARVVQADYLRVELPRHDGRTAFVGNPPYVRHHDLTPETKDCAASLGTRVGHTVSGLAGLHALFYLATLAKHGAAGDIGSFVTSAEWLDVGYGSVIRSMFANGLGGRSLAVFDATSVPFDDAMTTAAITTFRIGEELDTARVARVADSKPFVLERFGRNVERSILRGAKRWSPLLRPSVPEVVRDTVGTMFRVSRGQVTGANAFFVMSRQEARDRGIERFCVPIVSACEEVFAAGGVLRDGPERLVGLEVRKDVNAARFPRLAAYVAAGEAAGVHTGYVASRRSPWWAVSFPKPPIVATYMARQAPFFAENPDALGLLNVAHGLHPRVPIDATAITSVVTTLNANRASFVGRGRVYHGGLEKFEPREMEALPLPTLA